MANKRKVSDLNQFEFYIEEFIKECEKKSIKPSDHNLRIFLNVSQSTLDRYYRGEKAGETYKGYDEVLKNLISYREHLLTSKLDEKGSNVAGAIIQLKQPKTADTQTFPQSLAEAQRSLLRSMESADWMHSNDFLLGEQGVSSIMPTILSGLTTI